MHKRRKAQMPHLHNGRRRTWSRMRGSGQYWKCRKNRGMENNNHKV